MKNVKSFECKLSILRRGLQKNIATNKIILNLKEETGDDHLVALAKLVIHNKHPECVCVSVSLNANCPRLRTVDLMFGWLFEVI